MRNVACMRCVNMQQCKTMQPDLIPTSEVAELLGISVATVNRWALIGSIKPAIEIAGRTGARLYRRSDIEKILEQELAETEVKANAIRESLNSNSSEAAS